MILTVSVIIIITAPKSLRLCDFREATVQKRLATKWRRRHRISPDLRHQGLQIL